MISKESTVKKIQKEISSQKYDEAIKFIEHNKRDLVEIDYWYYLSLCSRYSKKYNEALSELNFLEGTIFADKGIIMSGQIYERFYNDSSKASEFYFRIINDYPESIFSEPIRYHLRKLKDNEKI